jgi:hypothetical protein
VRNHATNRHGVVLEVETLDRCLEELAVEIEAQLVVWTERPTLDTREPPEAGLQARGTRVDRGLRIVGPPTVLARIPNRSGQFGIQSSSSCARSMSAGLRDVRDTQVALSKAIGSRTAR